MGTSTYETCISMEKHILKMVTVTVTIRYLLIPYLKYYLSPTLSEAGP